VSYGNDVTIFTSSFNGCEAETFRSGIRVVRDGGKYSVYVKARRFVKRHLSEFDVIVDEINTVPFQIRGTARGKPVLAMIHQLAKEVWFYETRFPLNVLGYYALEPFWLRKYKRFPIVTVSESTKQDLLHLGFEHVHIVYNGIAATPLDKPGKKETHPVLIFLGRLVRCKLPSHAIEAFVKVKEIFPEAELWILGDGYLRSKLEKDAGDGVRFFGRVSDDEKLDLLTRAHLLLAPSVREGWGISVIEANAMGTPAVGYDVPGLCDSIIHGRTGLLVEPMNSQALADAATQILSSPSIADAFSLNALARSKEFSWDDSATKFEDILETISNGGHDSR
jgi:glycosyltransferase involved in cell wall biosynthesis